MKPALALQTKSIDVTRFRPEYVDFLIESYGPNVLLDEYDATSIFVTGRIHGQLRGIVRLTRGPHGPLSASAIGPFQLPDADSVVHMTRGAVHPDSRGRGLYRDMMIFAMDYARRAGFETAVAAITPDFKNRDFLKTLGFRDLPHLARFRYGGSLEGDLVQIVADLRV